MQKITCISYHATGSGAVDDYLREFSGVNFAHSGIECRFLQDPDGISDLEYNLVENPNRLNSGFALKRYLKFAKNNHRTYEHIFGNAWMLETERYINELISVKFKGYWHAEILLMPKLKQLYFKSRRAINKLLPSKYKEPSWKNYFPNEIFYHVYISREEFLMKTREYVNRLCSKCATGHDEFFVLDQFIPTTNLNHYLAYVDDLKVIIVDRDPRDVLIQNIIVNDHVLPKDPEVFATVYKDHRLMSCRNFGAPNILRIQFEDIIYHYDETTSKIRNFLGLDENHHINKYKYLNPEISKKNTKMWISHPEYAGIAHVIEDRIPEYIYHFNDVL